MEIKLFRTDKKLMCRLPGDKKDTPAAELFLGIIFLKPEKIKEKLGNEKPVIIPTCSITEQEEKDIAKINFYLDTIYIN